MRLHAQTNAWSRRLGKACPLLRHTMNTLIAMHQGKPDSIQQVGVHNCDAAYMAAECMRLLMLLALCRHARFTVCVTLASMLAELMQP